MGVNNSSKYINLLRQMGLKWFLFRSFYELQKKTGLLDKKNRLSPITDEELNLLLGKPDNKDDIRKKFSSPFMDQKKLEHIHNWITANYGQLDKERLLEIADNSVKGKIFCFSSWYSDYGHPIDWHLNLLTSNRYPADRHWAKIEELQEGEDIKLVWEASRFPHFYYLARAYTLTNDEKYPQAFWEQVEHWWHTNPPGYGPNWFCGQEVALRAMAWILGLFVFWGSENTTPERVKNLLKHLWCHGKRIEDNISFALKALGNNHAISEAAGLFSIGLLFPFFKESKRWQEKGKKYLTQEGLHQIYKDGSYIQHSFNYQRMVVQLYNWCLSLARANSITFDYELKDRLENCVHFLYSLQEKNSGILPNYGANDGAVPFPLTSCGYRDFRPQLNALWYSLKGKKLYEIGIYDEELLWFADDVNDPEYDPLSLKNAFKEGGYYILRGKESWGLTRCTSFKHRPGHADMLHFDLWWKGRNILIDAGSYSYNSSGWTDYFSSTGSHNTVMINGKDQMKRWQRFTWLDWTKSRLITFKNEDRFNCFEGEHYGYKEAVHRRCIVNSKNFWVIVDDILPNKSSNCNLKLHWLFADFPWKFLGKGILLLKIPEGNLNIHCWPFKNVNLSVEKGKKGERKRGWCSIYYGIKEPVPSLLTEIDAELPYRFITTILPEDAGEMVQVTNRKVHIKTRNGENLEFMLAEVGKEEIMVDLRTKE